MRNAKLYRYQLPMDSGVVLRDKKLVQRDGWIIELSENDKTAYGEVAPLPGFSLETVDEAGLQTQEQLELWVAKKSINFDALHPSVAFGLSIAECEMKDELPKEGNFFSAPLCSGDPDALIPALNALPTEKKVAKIKVGLYEPIRDGMIVNLFLESIPTLSLRLDANRAWTPETAQKFAEYINPSYRQRIDFLEEPCEKPEQSFAFAIDSGIAIAWDETLQNAVKEADFSLQNLAGAKVIVIKPTLIGSVERCRVLVEEAKRMAISVVISSSLESSLGLSQLARLAKWLTPDEVPGLDTIKLFGAQLEVAWPECDLPVARLLDQQIVWQS